MVVVGGAITSCLPGCICISGDMVCWHGWLHKANASGEGFVDVCAKIIIMTVDALLANLVFVALPKLSADEKEARTVRGVTYF